jgi:hypothetical protein
MQENIIHEIVVAAGMDPRGMVIGLVGAMISCLYRGAINWRAALVILFSGGALGGFATPFLVQQFKLSLASVNLSCLVIGFVSKDIFNGIQTGAPGLIKAALRQASKKIDNDGQSESDQ